MYVDKVLFNGKEINDFRMTVTDMMQGGTLEFYMCKQAK
jgi:putative alpha-1,2-mannosidase